MKEASKRKCSAKFDFPESLNDDSNYVDEINIKETNKAVFMDENTLSLPNSENETLMSTNTSKLIRSGDSFSLKITRSLSPTFFRKKTQQISLTSSKVVKSGSAYLSSPKQSRHPLFSKPLNKLFGSEPTISSEAENMVFLGQIYRDA